MAIGEQDTYVKVGAGDVEVGVPLRYPFYDGNRKLLLKRGYVIETVRQCEMLIERGLYRNVRERPAIPEPSVSESGAQSRDIFTTLEASKIRIGDTLLMQSSSDMPRLSVKLIGYLKNSGVIVTVPTNGGEFVMLKDGQSFVIRFFSGQSAYTFTATVVRQTSLPFPHVHLSYPREVRGQSVRKGARIDVELIAAVTLPGATEGEVQTRSGKIINLSTGGAALRSKQALGHKGDVIGVKFKILTHDIASYLDFASTIRMEKVDQADSNMPHLYGIEFANADQGMSLALAAFVYEKIFHES